MDLLKHLLNHRGHREHRERKRLCVSYRDPLLAAAYYDPTPRNRRHAIHALSCEKCKPNRCRLDIDIRADLRRIIEADPDASVCETAQHELDEIGVV